MASYQSFIKCVICCAKRTNTPNLFMASLPLDPTRCREWLRAIGQDELVDLPIEKLHQLKYVCGRHFTAEDFNRQGNRLLKCAVPNCNLPLPPLEDEVFIDFPQYIGSNVLTRKVLTLKGQHPSPVVKGTNESEPSVSTLKSTKLSNAMGPVRELRRDFNPYDALKEAKSQADYKKKAFDDENLLGPEPCNAPSPEVVPQTETVAQKKKIFSWEKQKDLVDISQDENENENKNADDAPDNLSMYCDDDAMSENTKQETRERKDGRFQCDNCKSDIFGFRYTCVQCHNFDLCTECEAKGTHDEHYMLRVPDARPNKEVQFILIMIRKYLLQALNPILTEGLDEISVKSEVKSEVEDNYFSDMEVENLEHDERRLDSRASTCATEETMYSEFDEVSPKKLTQVHEFNMDDEFELTLPNYTTSQSANPLSDADLDTVVMEHEPESNVLEQDENQVPVKDFDSHQAEQTNTAKRKNVDTLSDFVEPTALDYLAKRMRTAPSTNTTTSSIITTTKAQEAKSITVMKPPDGAGSNQKVPIIKIPAASVISQGQPAAVKNTPTTTGPQKFIKFKMDKGRLQGLMPSSKVKIIKLPLGALIKLGHTVPGKGNIVSPQGANKTTELTTTTVQDANKITKLTTISAQDANRTTEVETSIARDENVVTESEMCNFQDSVEVDTDVLRTNSSITMSKSWTMNPKVKLEKLPSKFFQQRKPASKECITPVASTQGLKIITPTEVRSACEVNPQIKLQKLSLGAITGQRGTVSVKSDLIASSPQKSYTRAKTSDVRRPLTKNPNLILQKVSVGTSSIPEQKVRKQIVSSTISRQEVMKLTTNESPKFYGANRRVNILSKPPSAVPRENQSAHATMDIVSIVVPAQSQSRATNRVLRTPPGGWCKQKQSVSLELRLPTNPQTSIKDMDSDS